MEVRKNCTHCSPSKSEQKNDVPGARLWETPAQTEERKRIACLMRNRPKAMSYVEKRVVVMLYGIDDDTKRMSCSAVARSLELKSADEVHAIAASALRKIFYRPPGSRRSSA